MDEWGSGFACGEPFYVPKGYAIFCRNVPIYGNKKYCKVRVNKQEVKTGELIDFLIRKVNKSNKRKK